MYFSNINIYVAVDNLISSCFKKKVFYL